MSDTIKISPQKYSAIIKNQEQLYDALESVADKSYFNSRDMSEIDCETHNIGQMLETLGTIGILDPWNPDSNSITQYSDYNSDLMEDFKETPDKVVAEHYNSEGLDPDEIVEELGRLGEDSPESYKSKIDEWNLRDD